MKIDRNELVCGVRPALLKKLFYRDVFDTLTAMRDLGLVEPEASQTLVALERDDWIGYDACVDHKAPDFAEQFHASFRQILEILLHHTVLDAWRARMHLYP